MFGKGYIFSVIKWFFRLVLITLIVFVVGIFVWRFITSTPPEDFMILTPTGQIAENYAESGSLYMITQEQNSITRGERSYGYFAVCDVVFIPEAEQLQVLVRYNDSTLKALKSDYAEDFTALGEDEYPDSALDWYDVSVVLARDITPDNSEDNFGNGREAVELIRIKPTEVSISEHIGRYSYRRFVFDDVPVDDLTLAVYADFYYLGDVAYEKDGFDIYTDEAYGTLCLYTFADNAVEVELTKNDVRAIEEYIK